MRGHRRAKPRSRRAPPRTTVPRAVEYSAVPSTGTTTSAAARAYARRADRSIPASLAGTGIVGARARDLPAPASPVGTPDWPLRGGQDTPRCSRIQLGIARCPVPRPTQPRALGLHAQPRRVDRAGFVRPPVDSRPLRSRRWCAATPEFSCKRANKNAGAKPRAILSSLVNCNDRSAAAVAIPNGRHLRGHSNLRATTGSTVAARRAGK